MTLLEIASKFITGKKIIVYRHTINNQIHLHKGSFKNVKIIVGKVKRISAEIIPYEGDSIDLIVEIDNKEEVIFMNSITDDIEFYVKPKS